MYKFKLKKQFDNFNLDVSFSISAKETLVILGPSGCGKSTILNLITGIVNIDEGYIKTKDKVLVDTAKKINVEIHKRNIGYIQQKSNLFPHLSVFDNITYAVKDKKSIKDSKQLKRYIDIFQLNEHLNKKCNEISGGQQQRVSIIRALMSNPKLLLFDEPFSALDSPLRISFREQIVKIKEELDVPIIFVTHDLEEGYDIGNRIIIMDKGKIVEHGSREQIFNFPKQLVTADFIGVKNIWDGQVLSSEGKISTVYIGGISLKVNKKLEIGKKIKIGIKSTDIIYMKDNKEDLADNQNIFCAKVLEIKRSYNSFKLEVRIDKLYETVMIKLPEYIVHTNKIKIADSIKICLKYKSIIVIDCA